MTLIFPCMMNDLGLWIIYRIDLYCIYLEKRNSTTAFDYLPFWVKERLLDFEYVMLRKRLKDTKWRRKNLWPQNLKSVCIGDLFFLTMKMVSDFKVQFIWCQASVWQLLNIFIVCQISCASSIHLVHLSVCLVCSCSPLTSMKVLDLFFFFFQ